jgi:sulfite oxidase
MKSAAFHTITHTPLNGAPDAAALVRSHSTEAEDFFVRNHGEPPSGNLAEDGTPRLQLKVHGMVRMPLNISTSFLSSIGTRTPVEASLQCAGNRRAALQRIRPIPNEIPWDSAAIGNAVWTGVRLADVLAHAGVVEGAAHVWFFGADVLAGKHAGESFGGSIPLAKAMDPHTLLADTMNGVPLPDAHGAPLRVVVPGYIGARSVKWLKEIRVEREPTPNHFQRAYSLFPSSTLAVPDGHAGGRILDEFPVSSAFGSPASGDILSPGRTVARGWAIGTGSRTVERVEVSTDGGGRWTEGRFVSPARPYVWRLWEADLELRHGTHELICRAVDDGGNVQPDDASFTWNVKGYVNNCWDRISVRVE